MEPKPITPGNHDPETDFYFENLRVINPDGSFTAIYYSRSYDTKIGPLLGTNESIEQRQPLIEVYFNSHALKALNISNNPQSIIEVASVSNFPFSAEYTAEFAGNLLGLRKILLEHPDLELAKPTEKEPYIVMTSDSLEAMLAVNNLGFHFIQNLYDRMGKRQYGNGYEQPTYNSGIYFLPDYIKRRSCYHTALSRSTLLNNGDYFEALSRLTYTNQNRDNNASLAV